MGYDGLAAGIPRVGDPIEVYWDGDDTYYPGRVLKSGLRGVCTVIYDDNECRQENLLKMNWRLSETAPEEVKERVKREAEFWELADSQKKKISGSTSASTPSSNIESSNSSPAKRKRGRPRKDASLSIKDGGQDSYSSGAGKKSRRNISSPLNVNRGSRLKGSSGHSRELPPFSLKEAVKSSGMEATKMSSSPGAHVYCDVDPIDSHILEKAPHSTTLNTSSDVHGREDSNAQLSNELMSNDSGPFQTLPECNEVVGFHKTSATEGLPQETHDEEARARGANVIRDGSLQNSVAMAVSNHFAQLAKNLTSFIDSALRNAENDLLTRLAKEVTDQNCAQNDRQ